MKLRRINPNWVIDQDRKVYNTLNEYVGEARIDANGEYYLLTPSELVNALPVPSFNNLLEVLKTN